MALADVDQEICFFLAMSCFVFLDFFFPVGITKFVLKYFLSDRHLPPITVTLIKIFLVYNFSHCVFAVVVGLKTFWEHIFKLYLSRIETCANNRDLVRSCNLDNFKQ